MGSQTYTSMKTKLSITILTVLVAIACPYHAKGASPAEKPKVAAKDAEVVEQAVPVVALLRSVKESNAELFQQCWDKTMAERMGLTPESAKKMIEQYRLVFDKALGEYAMEDFSYHYVGTANAGAVTVKFKDKNIPPLKVVKTGNDWKLGER